MIDADLAAAFTGELTDWLEALPAYQRETINKMLVGRDPIEVSLAWLAVQDLQTQNLSALFGSTPNVFYDSLLEQLQSLLCGKKDYIKERDDLKGSINAGRATIVTAVSGYIAPHLGASPILLAPAVALILAVLTKTGSDSLCTTLNQLIEDRKSTDSKK